jgi:hypothetical protein
MTMTSPAHRIDRIAGWLLLMLFALLALRTHTTLHGHLIDDAYITFRYAANFANGAGFVYNPGEWIMGTTAPGYGLLLGMIAVFTGAETIPAIARAVNLIGVLVAAGSAAYIVRRIGGGMIVTALVAGVVLLGPQLHYASLAGMETPLFLALLGLTLAALVDRRWLLAALFAGLLPLVRPSGVFVVALVGLHLFFVLPTWPARLRRWTLLLLPGALLALSLLVFYGSLLPQSVTAKRAGIYPLELWETADSIVRYVGHDIIRLSGFISVANDDENRLRFIAAAALTVAALVISGVWFVRKNRALGLIPVITAILLVFFATSQTIIFPHYYAMFEALMIVCWWAALIASGRWLLARLERLRDIPRTAITGLAGVVMIAAGSYVYYPVLTSFDWDAVRHGERAELPPDELRMIAYDDLAAELYDWLPEDTTILMTEIGVLGYRLDHVRVLDAAGLVSPEAVEYLPVADEQRLSPYFGVVPPEMLFDYMPDMLISMDIFMLAGVYEDPRLWENYTPILWIPADDWLPWGSQSIYIFTRHDFEPGQALDEIGDSFNGYTPQPAGT